MKYNNIYATPEHTSIYHMKKAYKVNEYAFISMHAHLHKIATQEPTMYS